jgi:ATP-dependent Lhr-like helicase
MARLDNNIHINQLGTTVVEAWLAGKGMKPFLFQQEAWSSIGKKKSGLVNAPTGCGKTYAVFLGAIIDFINTNPADWQSKRNNGLQLIWITPLRALAKDIGRAMEEAIAELGMSWRVGIRNGDTTTNERAKQKRSMPEILIITPESLHLLLASKQNHQLFATLSTIAVDEWHELLGSKRGVQTELAISYLAYIKSMHTGAQLQVWGISATIGNLEEACQVLMAPIGVFVKSEAGISPEIIKANLDKKIAVHAIIPEEITNYPWAGHLGIKLAHQIVPIIEASETTLIFINTRGMAERWYQTLLDVAPQLAGAIALHHGSIEQELRLWVEDALHTQQLKAVVCTASLDLGVDFRPVNTVIQVGSPKGVSRFLQRAGRAGHQPGAISNIYFLPTHALELLEVTDAAAVLLPAVRVDVGGDDADTVTGDVGTDLLLGGGRHRGFLGDPDLPPARGVSTDRRPRGPRRSRPVRATVWPRSRKKWRAPAALRVRGRNAGCRAGSSGTAAR